MCDLKKECSVLNDVLKEQHFGLSFYDTHFDIIPELKLFRVIDIAIAAYTLDSAINYYKKHIGVDVDINDGDVYEISNSQMDNYVGVTLKSKTAKEFDFLFRWEI